MKRKRLSTAFVILFVGFMVILEVHSHPYKWPKFYSPNDDISSEVVRVPSDPAGQATTVSEKSREMKSSVDQGTDDEAEKRLEETLGVSSIVKGDEKSTNNEQVGPDDEISYRKYDYKLITRPTGLIPHNPRDRIVFPDDVESMNREKMARLSGCTGATFCEDIPYYPTEVVNNAIRSNSKLKYLETLDELEPPVIGERISDDEDTLCISKEHLVRPKVALNKDKEWRYILNNDNFTQAIRVEICNTDNRPCEIIDGFADGYQTMCKQKYVYRQLVAITDSNSVSPEMFQMPASCCCQIKWVASPLLRIGIDVKKGNNDS